MSPKSRSSNSVNAASTVANDSSVFATASDDGSRDPRTDSASEDFPGMRRMSGTMTMTAQVARMATAAPRAASADDSIIPPSTTATTPKRMVATPPDQPGSQLTGSESAF